MANFVRQLSANAMSGLKIQKLNSGQRYKAPKFVKMKFDKVIKTKLKDAKLKKMDQYLGVRTTAQSRAEGRLKVANTKRKIAKTAIKKAKKPTSGMKQVFSMV